MKKLNTKNAPEAIGPYSQAVVTDSFIFISGQLGIMPETGALARGIEAQSAEVIKNIGSILEEAGLNYADVVKTTCYLKDMDDFPVFNGIYAAYFTGKPARSCVGVSALPKGALVEIDVIAQMRVGRAL